MLLRVQYNTRLSSLAFDEAPSWNEFKSAAVEKFDELIDQLFTVKTDGGIDLEKCALRFANVVWLRPTSTFYIYLKSEEVPEEKMPQSSSMGKNILIGVGVGAVATAAAAPVLVAAAGFGAAGVVGGSLAALVQSSIGNVVAGTAFASLQSAGMAGMAATGFGTAGAAGGAVGGAMGAAASFFFGKKNNRDDAEQVKQRDGVFFLPNKAGILLYFSSKLRTETEKIDDKGNRSNDRSKSVTFTYKIRTEELRQLFTNLPAEEQLIVDYSCSFHKNILIPGRMYVTTNYLCFYSRLIGIETSHVIRMSEITKIAKEKTAYVLSIAIQLNTAGEKHRFSSFPSCDEAYETITLIWKKARNGEEFSSMDLLELIIFLFGEDLGFFSSEEIQKYFFGR